MFYNFQRERESEERACGIIIDEREGKQITPLTRCTKIIGAANFYE